MRTPFFALAFLAACGPAPERPADAPALPAPAAGPWFICDAIDEPAVLVFEREGGVVRVAKYDKPNGAIVERTEYALGAEEGAAGSVYTGLLSEGADAGHVRALNPDMLETPGTAFTTPITSVRLGEREFSCRWLPRTRLMGFTGRRSFVVSEDADGDLLYQSFDFADAAQARPVELSDNGRSSTFSAEWRGGEETLTPEGVGFRFQPHSELMVTVWRARDGTGTLNVTAQERLIQSEQLIAVQQGSGEE